MRSQLVLINKSNTEALPGTANRWLTKRNSLLLGNAAPRSDPFCGVDVATLAQGIMRLTLAMLVVLVFASVVCARQAPRVTVAEIHPTVIGGSINEYTSAPPDIILTPPGEGARRGRLWIRNIGKGLLIAGDIEGGPPDFPRDKDSLLAKDHVEIWLTAGVDPVLPPIGWGHQFGENTLPDGADSCADDLDETDISRDPSPDAQRKCREWAAKQEKYRRYFQRLFLRQWLLAPDYAVESFAAPAYEEIASRFASKEEIPAALKLRGNPKFWYSPSAKGYTFQVLIPYGIFPPLPSLDLRDLRLLVDVFSAAPAGKKMGAFSGSSPARVWAKPETFNTLRIDPPRVFHMTPCNLPLNGTDIYGNVHNAWFIPQEEQKGEYESDAFLIVNGAGGYRYEPGGLSPVTRPVHDFWISVSPGEWICGPQLTHKKGNERAAFAQRVDAEGLATHHLPDGDLLVKVGPSASYSEFGSGQCGGCPYTNLTIYRLTADNKIYEALKLGDVIAGPGPGPQDQDFTVSPDWSQVNEYDQEQDDDKGNPGSWSSTTYCLKDSHYEKCGEKSDVVPPNPRLSKNSDRKSINLCKDEHHGHKKEN
jgi:hypothetical protein